MKITIGIDGKGIDKAIRDTERYQKWVERKSKELVRRLAQHGATYASLEFSRAIYTGENDYKVTVEPKGDNAYIVKATGDSVLFVEFGAGYRYGNGHPEEATFNYGAGTYPEGKGHWKDPKGWWLPREKTGGIATHTYGNPPNAPMYNARKQVVEDIEQIAREVFNS